MLKSELVERVWNEFLYPAGANRPTFDILDGNITAAATTLRLEGIQEFVPQGIIEIDSELILTKDEEASVDIDVAQRGYGATTAATHDDGARVYFNPEFPRQTISDAIDNCVAQLNGMGLYARDSISMTFSDSVLYALPTGALEVLTIVDEDTGHELSAGREFKEIRAFTPPKVRLVSGASGATTIVYSKDFVAPASEATDLTTTSLVPASLVPFIPLYAAGYLLQGRELTMLQVESVRQRLAVEGINPGSITSIARALMDLFEQKYVGREIVKQTKKDPPRWRFVA